MRYSDLKIFRFDFVSLYYLIYKIAQDMNVGNTVFSQLMSLIPDYELRKCIDKYRGDFHARRFTCRDQFLVMSYAQLTSSASLRSIEAQLTAFNSKLYHAGLKIMPKSTLADMNEKKDWRIYQDYAMVLVERAKVLYCIKTNTIDWVLRIWCTPSTAVPSICVCNSVLGRSSIMTKVPSRCIP